MTTFFFIFTLILVGVIDAATRKIPPVFPLFISLLALLKFAHSPETLTSGIIGLFALGIPMLLLALYKGGLGGGDIKLAAACGLYLGADAALSGLLIAGVLALMVQAVCLLSNKKNSPKASFAFGPYLAVGFLLAAFVC